MSKRQLWAIGRFDDVRLALRADDILVSGEGVAANDPVNGRNNPITLSSDGETHLRRRRILIEPLMPGKLSMLRPRLEDAAQRLVQHLKSKNQFEGMQAFASYLPLTVVSELVGLNDYGRQKMLIWAAATFDALGVMNERGVAALPIMAELSTYVARLGPDEVVPGGWASRLFAAVESKELTPDEARFMVIDYVAPALDTTILATGEMLFRLATTEGAYETVLADPKLIPGAVNESVRLASPIRGFTRKALEDYQCTDVIVPKGDRVLILFASANWDERHYANPDDFLVDRNPRDHVGWGHGPHACAGMHLARMEMEVLLQALVNDVRRIEVSGPVRIMNNVLQGFSSLTVSFH